MKIPEIRLIATPENEEARGVLGFEWAGGDIGKRHKLGGSPDWLQDPEVPKCPECHHAMDFYGQLDSIGDRVCLADCGIVYVFVCHDCYETQSIFQSG